MHIAKDFMIGPTHIRICDDECVTREETEEILAGMARRMQPYFAAKELEARKLGRFGEYGYFKDELPGMMGRRKGAGVECTDEISWGKMGDSKMDHRVLPRAPQLP